jgi:hypothetical protein
MQVTAINRAAHTVEVSDGSTIAYSKLVLATGAANRELTVPGSGLEGIHGLRTLADAETVHARLNSASSVVVIGAGFIRLELAAVARKSGLDVTALELADRPMGRALSPVMSRWWHKRPDCTKAGTSKSSQWVKRRASRSPDPSACRPGSKVANGPQGVAVIWLLGCAGEVCPGNDLAAIAFFEFGSSKPYSLKIGAGDESYAGDVEIGWEDGVAS